MKKIYSIFLLLAIVNVKNSMSQANIIASYNFNGGSAIDASGNGYTGIFYGSSVDIDTLNIGYNTIDYFSVPAQVLNSRVQFSMLFRIKFTGFNTTGQYPTNTIFSSDNNSSVGIFAFSYQKDINTWRVGNGVTAFDFIGNSIVIDKWYCVTLTRDNLGTMKLYVNGVQNTTVNSYTTAINITSFLIGQETDCFAGCFATNQSGYEKFDDIKFYDNALTPSEISSNCFLLIGINEYQKVQMGIYPNPLNGNILKIKNTNTIGNANIEILSVEGKILKDLIFNNEVEWTIDMSDIKPGIYFIKIMSDSQSSVMKFIK